MLGAWLTLLTYFLQPEPNERRTKEAKKGGAREYRSGANRESVPIGIDKLGTHHLRDGQAGGVCPLENGVA